MTYLGLSQDVLKKQSAFWTAKETQQQPEVWLKTQENLNKNANQINAFLEPIVERENLRIILTGAGTSAYIGECLAPFLLNKTAADISAIATTDLVSGPHLYFKKNVPTLIISFSRSGSSPESLAAVTLSNQMIDQCYQLIITCNQDGALYKDSIDDENSLAILMPEETHDRSFAMTSSFSSMMYTALCLFAEHDIDCDTMSRASNDVINSHNDMLKNIAQKEFWRVVYIGSNGFNGLAREASLKLLELTNGQIVTTYESSLGFRHGPKSIITDKTLIFMFISNDPYTRQYDLDLFDEIRNDNEVGQVIAISAKPDDRILNGDHLIVPHMQNSTDIELLFPYILYAQIYAFHRALKLGNTPDNPCPSGTVNRVVQGVTLYDYKED